jgi:CMP/dCMP kinase
MTKAEIIAIDGPASSGKSTVAAILAKELGYLYFDTGVMYRAVTYAVLQKNIPIPDEGAVSAEANAVRIDVNPPSVSDGRQYDVILDDADVTWQIRSREVEGQVSPVSTYAGVRKAMTEQQRRIGLQGRVVMVGRDIGTVVLPEAPVKVYLDASVEERARRRHKELVERGEQVEFETILNNLRSRDQIDSTRKVAPLKMADDAHYILSDGLTIQEVVERIKTWL